MTLKTLFKMSYHWRYFSLSFILYSLIHQELSLTSLQHTMGTSSAIMSSPWCHWAQSVVGLRSSIFPTQPSGGHYTSLCSPDKLVFWAVSWRNSVLYELKGVIASAPCFVFCCLLIFVSVLVTTFWFISICSSEFPEVNADDCLEMQPFKFPNDAIKHQARTKAQGSGLVWTL